MSYARLFPIVALAAAVAACSGNLGGGQSTLPGAPTTGTNVQQVAVAAATPTPQSASNVATLGDTVAPQALPTVMGWAGSIAFAKPAGASPNPKGSAQAADAAGGPVSIGITASVVEPPDAPHLGSAAKKRHVKRDPNTPTGLFYVSLLATSDVTLPEYPKLALEVPREIIAKHHDDTFALALFDPERKEKSYRLAVADRDLSSPAPGSIPVSTPVPTPTPTATPTPANMFNGPAALTPPPVGSGLGGTSGLPPEHIAFKATAQQLTLKANRPVVFALYALPPQPSPTPAPSTSPSAHSGSAEPTGSPAGAQQSGTPKNTVPAGVPSSSPSPT